MISLRYHFQATFIRAKKNGSGRFARFLFTRKLIRGMLEKFSSKYFSSLYRRDILDAYMLEKYMLELGTSSGNWNWNWELSFWHLFLKWKWNLSRAQFHKNWPKSHFLITKICIRVNIFELFFIICSTKKELENIYSNTNFHYKKMWIWPIFVKLSPKIHTYVVCIEVEFFCNKQAPQQIGQLALHKPNLT